MPNLIFWRRVLPLLAVVWLLSPAAASAKPPPPAFFAMDTGTRDAAHATLGEQLRLVKELGYAGFGGTLQDPAALPALLAEAAKVGTKLTTLYAGLDLSAAPTNVPANLAAAVAALRGQETILWLTVQNSKVATSAPGGDAVAVPVLRQLADLAAAAGIRVALYPHTGLWVERAEDAARLANAVNRPNLGATFNLCHWLKVDGRDLAATLRTVGARLMVATVNGADRDGQDWRHLIQPLGRGTYDVRPVMAALDRIGFTGPVGLQLYGVGGNAEENLRASLAAWRELGEGAGTGGR